MAEHEILYAAPTAWSVKTLHGHAEVGCIYRNPDDPARSYMATNGHKWSHEPTLEHAIEWVRMNPRPFPVRASVGSHSHDVTTEECADCIAAREQEASTPF